MKCRPHTHTDIMHTLNRHAHVCVCVPCLCMCVFVCLCVCVCVCVCMCVCVHCTYTVAMWFQLLVSLWSFACSSLVQAALCGDLMNSHLLSN